MEEIGGSVRRALQSAGVPDAGVLADVVRAWPNAVGAEVSRAAWPQRIARDGTLHVTTTSSIWAFELGRLEAEIRAKLALAVGEATPPALRFATGPVPERAADPERFRFDAPEPTLEEEARAAALASSITGAELREAVRAAVAAGLAAHRSDRDL